MKSYLLKFLLVVLLPTSLQAQEKTVTVPFELLKSQHMVVNVKVNGKGPYRLIFDTGAPESLVSNKVRKEADLKPSKLAGTPVLPIFGARGQFTIDTLEIGDLKAEKLTTMVLDHPTVAAISGVAGPIEGIVGFTFFGRFRTTIDYEKKQLVLESSKYEPGDLMQALMKKLLNPPKGAPTAPVLAPGGQLGVKLKENRDDEPGVTIAEVLADSAAQTAGLQAGDRLLSLDRRWTDTLIDVFYATHQLRPGSTTDAVVRRDGKELTLKLTLKAGL